MLVIAPNKDGQKKKYDCPGTSKQNMWTLHFVTITETVAMRMQIEAGYLFERTINA
jgi:hypothetical protein